MSAVIFEMSLSSALTKMKGTGSFMSVFSSCWMRSTPAVEPLEPRLEGPAPMTEDLDRLLAIAGGRVRARQQHHMEVCNSDVRDSARRACV